MNKNPFISLTKLDGKTIEVNIFQIRAYYHDDAHSPTAPIGPSIPATILFIDLPRCVGVKESVEEIKMIINNTLNHP